LSIKTLIYEIYLSADSSIRSGLVGDSEPSFNGDETLLCCGDLLFLSGDLDIFLDPDLLRLKDFLLGDPDLLLDLDLDFDLCLKQISLICL
jgi:hypothetical protein